MKTATQLRVHVSRQFAASAEHVFESWLDAERLAEWMFCTGTRDPASVRIDLDPPVGTFALVVARQGREIEYFVEVLAIEPSRRIVFTWATAKSLPDRDLVTVEFAPMSSGTAGCSLKLTDELPRDWADHADSTKAAWTKLLDTLVAALSETERS